jgi:septal ring-binding cell division protein DamX
MLKKNSFRKRSRRIRKPDFAALALGSLTVLLLLAWGGLYWQDRSAGATAAQDNDEAELPVIMLDLDAAQAPQPQEGEASQGNGSAVDPAGGPESQTPGQMLEDLAQSPGGLLGMEDDWPNLANPPKGTNGGEQGAAVPTQGTQPTESGSDEGAAQVPVPGAPTTKPTPSLAPEPTPKPTKAPGPGPIETSKPSASPAATEKPSASPSPSPAVTPPPDGSGADPVQEYELELLGLQAGCIMDVKAVLQEVEAEMGKTDPSDIEAIQRIGAEAAASLEAAGAACEIEFNEVAARAAQDGVSADQIGEWRQTYNEVMDQLRAEAELKLQQLLLG